MNDEDEPRALLGATISPLAAAVIYREMGADLRRRVIALQALGQVDAALDSARHLSHALAQLRAAAQQLENSGPSADVPVSAEPSCDAAADLDPRGWSTTAEVATVLGISPRGVRDLKGVRLRAVMVRGRLLFDPVTVAAEKQRRSASGGPVMTSPWGNCGTSPTP